MSDLAGSITIERNTKPDLSTTRILKNKGIDFKLVVLKKDLIEANKNISRSLNVPLASYVYEIKRLLIVQGIPKAIEISFIPMDLIPGFESIEIEQNSLYEVLKKEYGIEIDRSEETITLIKAGNAEKMLLRLKDDDLISINGVSSDKTGTIVEMYQTIAVCDFFIFKSEI